MPFTSRFIIRLTKPGHIVCFTISSMSMVAKPFLYSTLEFNISWRDIFNPHFVLNRFSSITSEGFASNGVGCIMVAIHIFPLITQLRLKLFKVFFKLTSVYSRPKQSSKVTIFIPLHKFCLPVTFKRFISKICSFVKSFHYSLLHLQGLPSSLLVCVLNHLERHLDDRTIISTVVEKHCEPTLISPHIILMKPIFSDFFYFGFMLWSIT
jgi:hypothetical protein